MFAALKAEFLKAATIKSTYIYCICIAGTLAAPAVLAPLTSSDLSGVEWDTLTMGQNIALVVAMVFGASTVGSDIGTRMNAQAFLLQQSRSFYQLAKIIMVVVLTFLSSVFGFIVSVASLFAHGYTTSFSGHIGQFWLLILSAPIFASIMAGLATVLRSSTAAVTAGVIWVIIVEPMAWTFRGHYEWLDQLMQLFPVTALGVLANTLPFDISDALAGAVLFAWIVACIGVGFACNQRRDIR